LIEWGFFEFYFAVGASQAMKIRLLTDTTSPPPMGYLQPLLPKPPNPDAHPKTAPDH